MKKFLAMLLALVLALGLTTLSWATGNVANIGDTGYESLDAAITAVKDGETIVIQAGEYTLNGALTYTGKAFTIQAAKDEDGKYAEVKFDMTNAVALHGAKITFEGVIFEYKSNGNYKGLQHTDTLVYNNCTFNGQVFLYAASETFNSCTFNQTSKDAYNVWTYGARNVKFNGCTFNCAGKSVLVYNEGTNPSTDLEVEKCEFIASQPVEGKAAIEVDTSLMSQTSTISVDKDTSATGFGTGSKSGNSLWNVKKEKEGTDTPSTTVEVAGNTVWENGEKVELPEPPAPRYYYNSTTTDTKADGTKGSPKTFDAGMGIYALTAVLSVTGMAYVGKKKF